jgi:lipoprotein-anchoring transpeptidase ErfK/SrfK
MYRRRRKRRGPKVLFVLCIAAVAGSWWYLSSRQTHNETPPAPVVAQQHAEPQRPVTPPPATRTVETTTRVATTAPAPASPAPAPGWRISEPPAGNSNQTTTTTPAAAANPPSDGSFFGASDVNTVARQYLAEGDLLGARDVLSQAVQAGTLPAADDEEARYMSAAINDRLVFSNEIIPGDPYSLQYVVRSGDSLSSIVKNLGLQVDWRFLQRINGLPRPDTIRVGQTLKVVTGPFHADVDRERHRLSLYLGEGPDRIFVRDFLVGLGAYESTPSGLFRVREHSKLVNPPWTNPRTRERYAANDPDNPIGEFWLGLEGIDEHNRQEAGFGLHGTIDPDSIGRNESMGCIRLDDGDIDLIYEVLAEGVSVVSVDPYETVAGVPGG